ncbi:hypothetical protein HNP37_003983 [Flavobacterium nitrogenifigens]|uniref:Uncharacterized protein n=2 Tax=Flavobacterium TaxID=237 RepID=A0A7W7J0H0_9FLAO|nr:MULTISPECIES: hypothetical protein [Flavobacterium]MBB4803903.1 hypothetical protein [Flavobacterium nitrogenifigens]MBB6388945.1 hypothetical protein [Flavobacterium notoginsengisoli]
MEIYKGTGKTTTGTILLTKGISAFVIGSSVEFEDLTTETIRVEIERANGSNFEITKGTMSLADFILATTYGEDAITNNVVRGLKTVAVCEISAHGAVHLFEKDVIKVTLAGLVNAETYVLNGIEEPETGTEIYSFERKSMAPDDTNKDFNVAGFDILILDKSADIEEVNYTFENGRTVKYSLFELEAMSASVDPVAYVKNDGKVDSLFSKKIQLPLLAVVNVNIRKSQGALPVSLILRNQL